MGFVAPDLFRCGLHANLAGFILPWGSYSAGWLFPWHNISALITLTAKIERVSAHLQHVHGLPRDAREMY